MIELEYVARARRQKCYKLPSFRQSDTPDKIDTPMKPLTPLQDVESLDAAIAESRERPVLLFKHSRHCGTSFEALDELHAHIESAQPGTAAYKMITVQTHRLLSDAVTQRFGIRHETPQAILLRDGKVIWNASHFRITASQLGEALNR